MKTVKRTLLIYATFILASCSTNTVEEENKEPEKHEQTTTKTVEKTKNSGQASINDGVSAANALQVAKSIDDFSTLVAAIEAAGVENSVVNTGPLTIFAPLNTAFAKLPEGTVETLVKPENKAKLAFILTNHVAPANYPAKQLRKEAKKGRKLYMASGKYLTVENKEDGLYVGGTKIIKTVQVSNGWIHVIDNVLVPAE